MTITLPNQYPFPEPPAVTARAVLFSFLVLLSLTLMSILTREKPEALATPLPPPSAGFPNDPEPPVIDKPDIVKTPDVSIQPTLFSQPVLREPPRTFDLPDLATGPGEFGKGGPVGFHPTAYTPEIPTHWLDKMPGVIRMGSLKYPHDLKKARVEGSVVLLVVINERGQLVVEQVLSASNRGFIEPAVQAAEESLFESPMQAGKPVRSYYKLPFRFSLD